MRDLPDRLYDGVPRPEAPPHPATILVIEDDPTIRLGMEMLLGAWGYTALCAASAEAALDLLDHSAARPDVVVADYGLEDGRNGAEAIGAIQARYGPDIPAVILTADTAPHRLRAATEAGFPLLHKPLEPAALRGVLGALTRG